MTGVSLLYKTVFGWSHPDMVFRTVVTFCFIVGLHITIHSNNDLTYYWLLWLHTPVWQLLLIVNFKQHHLQQI